MTILVIGATGTVGSQVIEQLTKRAADVRALVRDTTKANFPAGVDIVQGDLLDVDSLRSAFAGVLTPPFCVLPITSVTTSRLRM